MLNVGFSELFLIVVAALLFVGPKDYPTVIRAIANAVREFRALVDGVKGQVNTVMRESGMHDAVSGSLIDLDGKKQVTYDISDLTDAPRTHATTERGDD